MSGALAVASHQAPAAGLRRVYSHWRRVGCPWGSGPAVCEDWNDLLIKNPPAGSDNH
eukprot:COSAG06_NODE_61873_length_266_cov_1.023952_1_plen_56_part_01